MEIGQHEVYYLKWETGSNKEIGPTFKLSGSCNRL
jgi:hypothetical protein